MSETIVTCQSFVGVDLHKNTVTLAAVRPDGTLLDRVKIPTKCRDRIASWLLSRPRPSHLAVEAVGFVGWFIDDYRGCVDRIDIVDATELANRRGYLLKPVQQQAFAPAALDRKLDAAKASDNLEMTVPRRCSENTRP